MVTIFSAPPDNTVTLSVLALSSRFDGPDYLPLASFSASFFQYSLCRVVLMVDDRPTKWRRIRTLSVLALSSRFDGRDTLVLDDETAILSVLALSSRFDGLLRP